MDTVSPPVGVGAVLYRMYGSVAVRLPAGCENIGETPSADKGTALQWDKANMVRPHLDCETSCNVQYKQLVLRA